MPQVTGYIENRLRVGLGRRAGAVVEQLLKWLDPVNGEFRLFEDFVQKPGSTLPGEFSTQDTSSAGSPTLDYGTDASGGTYVLKLAADNEVETLTLYGGDNHILDITKKPRIKVRLKVESDVTGAGGAFAAGDKFVCGLASDRNATLDSVVTNAWFRFEGANHNILVETDDGTTDNDDNDTGSDWAENTYLILEIDCSTLADIRFLVNGSDVTPETMTLAAATGGVSFFLEIQKAAAANKDHRVTVDWIEIIQQR